MCNDSVWRNFGTEWEGGKGKMCNDSALRNFGKGREGKGKGKGKGKEDYSVMIIEKMRGSDHYTLGWDWGHSYPDVKVTNKMV